ncbi:MAG: phosphoethanolamine--lipid A transferase [Bacteriovoracaceae bacterium]|nr:phosphoethanolamine--lipid A transferase [Bacteriovoracaceae bacterium]
MKLQSTQTKIIFIVSLYFLLFYNFTFFSKTLNVYPWNMENAYSLFTLTMVLYFVTNLVLNVLRLKSTLKGFLIALFFLSTTAAYVMDSYGSVIDDVMLVSVLHTDTKESLELLTLKFGVYFFFLFLIPSFLIYKVKIIVAPFRVEFISRLKSIGLSLLVIFVMIISAGKFYAHFFRTQKVLRYYTNPTYYIYSMGKLASTAFKKSQKPFTPIGLDAKMPLEQKKKLFIFVIGETARRDRFSLNGHTNKTNPLLEKEKVLSFKNVTSCGTLTAVSVPCIFSNLGRSQFSVDDATSRENLIDVLNHTKMVNILWRDNNSTSKGVADRVKFEDYKSKNLNTLCDKVECRDLGMLVGLQEHINSVKEPNIVIVLHQIGNHGPAYFKRYPKEYEVFKPVCLTSELSRCTNAQIENTYDNAILYTDYFLAQVISLLKNNSKEFDTSMLYVSDHGESLGENGVYLHGLPYMIAPKAQIEIPLIMWFGEGQDRQIDLKKLESKINNEYSHDNLFHTVLGLLKVKTEVYDQKKDILDGVILK